MKLLGVLAIVLFNTIVWVMFYFTRKESKRLGITHMTDIYFYEPAANLAMLMSLVSLVAIVEILI